MRTAVYDKNRNQMQAEGNTLTFNASGQSIVVNNVVGTYDAAGRVVETGGSITAVPATVSTGAISLSGAEQVVPAYNTYQAASTATVTITGTEKSQTFTPPLPSNCGYRSGNTCYDAGGGTIVINVIALSTGQSVAGYSFGISYSQPTDTPASIAAATAAAINSMTSQTGGTTATSNGAVVTLTLKAQYTSQVGFVVSGGMGCDGLFSPCSFSEATTPQGMITGNFVSTTPAVYDSGTMTAAISNFPVATYAYGSSDTPATIAAGLAAAINSVDGGSVSAVASGSTVQVSSKATGYGINWPIALSTTYNTSSFKSPSFGGTTTNVAGGYPAVAGTTGGTSYTQFVYSPSGAKIAVVQNGSLVKGTVPLPGGGSAIYHAAGFNYFRHKDWLGSSRLATTWGHNVYAKEAYAPFGETYNEVGQDRSFTGEDQDTSAGVYDFQFRKYDPIAGRWMSPDPSGLYYANPTNPQSLNLYSYVLNDPLRNADPNGLYCFYGDSNGGAQNSDPSQFDFQSSEGECTAPDENGNVGQWIADGGTYLNDNNESYDLAGRVQGYLETSDDPLANNYLPSVFDNTFVGIGADGQAALMDNTVSGSLDLATYLGNSNFNHNSLGVGSPFLLGSYGASHHPGYGFGYNLAASLHATVGYGDPSQLRGTSTTVSFNLADIVEIFGASLSYGGTWEHPYFQLSISPPLFGVGYGAYVGTYQTTGCTVPLETPGSGGCQ